jgi:hypothetical protein
MFGFNKLVYLGTYDVDSTLIGCIQVDDGFLVLARMLTLIFVNHVDDGGGLARTRRAIKQEIWEMLFGKYVLEKDAIERV